MNKHAFLIIAYNQPDYVESLILQLGGGTSERTNIYVHIDTKTFDNFHDVIAKYEICDNVKFFSRFNLHWGGYQIIDVQRAMIDLALQNKDNFYFHLLSNSEYLCRPLNELIDFFDNPCNQNKEYIECAPVEEIWTTNKVKTRFFCWNIHDIIDTRKWHLGLINRCFCKLQWLLHIRRKPFPYTKIYGGSSWWTLSRIGTQTVLSAFKNKQLSKRFRFTYAPDELFPSTVIGNCGLSIVSDYCLRNRNPENAGVSSFRYIPWWKKGSRNIHPLILDETDYLLIKKSGAFFCRKIDLKHSKGLISKLIADEDKTVE